MKISLDCDGVLADFSKLAIDVIREMFVPDLPPDYVHTAWSFSDILSEDQWKMVFGRMLATPQMWAELEPFEENCQALREYISSYGEDDVYFLTSRPACNGGSPVSMTGLWLFTQHLPIANLIVVSNPAEKSAILRENDITYSLDDYGPTIQGCLDIPGHRPFILSRPYNESYDLPRVYSVAEFLMTVEMHG